MHDDDGGPINPKARANARLPPEVNRAIFVRNLPFKITVDEIYDIFGKYGALRQVRLGVKPETRGKAYVIFEDIYDAKNAVDHLSGFNVGDRYIIVLYHNQKRQELVKQQKLDTQLKREQLEILKQKHGVDDSDPTLEKKKRRTD